MYQLAVKDAIMFSKVAIGIGVILYILIIISNVIVSVEPWGKIKFDFFAKFSKKISEKDYRNNL